MGRPLINEKGKKEKEALEMPAVKSERTYFLVFFFFFFTSTACCHINDYFTMSTVEIKSFNEFLVTFYSVEQLKEGRLFDSEMFLVNQFHPWKLQFGLYNNKEIFCSLIYFGDLVLMLILKFRF